MFLIIIDLITTGGCGDILTMDGAATIDLILGTIETGTINLLFIITLLQLLKLDHILIVEEGAIT